jgi:hypothetical protein
VCTGVPAHGRQRPKGGVTGVLLVDDIARASSGGKRKGNERDEKKCGALMSGSQLSWLQMPLVSSIGAG